MKANEIFLIIVVGVVTTIVGNIVWQRMQRTRSADVLSLVPKTADCGCGCS